MLILASNSPRRRELLLSLGIPFAVEAADIEEIESLDDPREVPLRNAERKAAAVAAAIRTTRFSVRIRSSYSAMRSSASRGTRPTHCAFCSRLQARRTR